MRSADDPEAGRAAHLVRGEREEIAANLLHVDGAMSRTLRRIDECYDATPAGAFAVFGDGIDRAERVGNVRHRQQFHVAGEVFVELAGIKQAGVTVDREKDELCAGALGQEMPRHDVAAVLHLGEQDFVAALDELMNIGTICQASVLSLIASPVPVGVSCMGWSVNML